MPYYLKMGGELLATFTTTGLDGFWWNGTATTTEAFHKIEHLMKQLVNFDGDMELVDQTWEKLDKMGIELETPEGEILKSPDRPFVLYIFEDGTARMRY